MGVDCSPAKCFNCPPPPRQLTLCGNLLWFGKAKSLPLVFTGQLQHLQGLSLCGQCACIVTRRPYAGNYKLNWGHSRSINMCHLDKSVNLSVLPIMCCALSCALCIHFLLSEFKLFVTRCQSHFRTLSCCPGTSTLLQEMLYSLNSTLGHLVDSDRGVRAADRGAHCCHCIIKCSEDLWLDPESMRRRKRCRDRRVREEVRSSKVEQHFFSEGFLTLLWSIHNDHVKMQGWWTN